MNKIAVTIGMLGLCFFGFEYDSGWAFAGAFFCFFSVID